jgi:hypothetical protein
VVEDFGFCIALKKHKQHSTKMRHKGADERTWEGMGLLSCYAELPRTMQHQQELLQRPMPSCGSSFFLKVDWISNTLLISSAFYLTFFISYDTTRSQY